VSVLLLNWSYLVRYEALKWQPPFTPLGDSTPSNGMIPPSFTIPKFFFHHLLHYSIPIMFVSIRFSYSCSYICFFVLQFGPSFCSCIACSCSAHICHHNHLSIVFLSLPYGNELSHLLNHLVKLMSSENFP